MCIAISSSKTHEQAKKETNAKHTEFLGDQRERGRRGLADAETKVACLAADHVDHIPAVHGLGVFVEVADDLGADFPTRKTYAQCAPYNKENT